MLLCACDDVVPELNAESGENSISSNDESKSKEEPKEEPKEDPTDEDPQKDPTEDPTEEDPTEEPTSGETLMVASMKIAYSELGLVYTGYAEDGKIAVQTFLRESMQYEQNLYVNYRYDTKGRVVSVIIYRNVDGYVPFELYRLEATYAGDSKNTASVKYYKDGELSEDAAKITYHENGTLSVVWFGADDDCDLMFSFDDQARFLTCAYDQEWGSYVMKYGTGANPEQLEMYSGNDGSLEGVADLTYTGDLLTMLLVEHDGGSSKIEYEYDANKVLTRVTTTISYVGQDRTMKTVAAATLDENSRIVVRETAMYQSDICAGKTVETFEYDEDGKLIQKETQRYDGDNQTPTTAWTDKVDTIYTGVNNLNLRIEANTNATIVKTIATAGTALNRIATNGTWDKIEIGEGEAKQTAYVLSTYIATNASDFTFTEVEQVILTVVGENKIVLRATPFIPENNDYRWDNAVILEFNAAYGTLKKIAVSASGDWYQVSYAGTIGDKTYNGSEVLYMAASSVFAGYVLDPSVSNIGTSGTLG